MRRMVEHYVHTAHSGALVLTPRRRPIPLAGLTRGVTPEAFSTAGQAMTWFTAEHPVLMGLINLAGPDAQVQQLAWALGTFLHWRGHLHDWADVAMAGLDASQRLGDKRGQVYAHRDLSRAFTLLGRFTESRHHAEQSLNLAIDVADRTAEAHARHELIWALGRQGRYLDALDHAKRSLELFRMVGHRLGYAMALNGLGTCEALLGRFERALSLCQQALIAFEELSEPKGEAASWDTLGFAHHHLGNHDEAIDCHRQALTRYVRVGDRIGEVEARIRLGNAYHVAGAKVAARDSWQHALDVLDELAHPHAMHVRALLRDTALGDDSQTVPLYWPHR